jgi:hypothetical protein
MTSSRRRASQLRDATADLDSDLDREHARTDVAAADALVDQSTTVTELLSVPPGELENVTGDERPSLSESQDSITAGDSVGLAVATTPVLSGSSVSVLPSSARRYEAPSITAHASYPRFPLVPKLSMTSGPQTVPPRVSVGTVNDEQLGSVGVGVGVGFASDAELSLVDVVEVLSPVADAKHADADADAVSPSSLPSLSSSMSHSSASSPEDDDADFDAAAMEEVLRFVEEQAVQQPADVMRARIGSADSPASPASHSSSSASPTPGERSQRHSRVAPAPEPLLDVDFDAGAGAHDGDRVESTAAASGAGSGSGDARHDYRVASLRLPRVLPEPAAALRASSSDKQLSPSKAASSDGLECARATAAVAASDAATDKKGASAAAAQPRRRARGHRRCYGRACRRRCRAINVWSERVLQPRLARVSRFCMTLVSGPLYDRFIIAAIIVNSALIASEYHGMSRHHEYVLNVAEIAFSALFFAGDVALTLS